MLDYLEIVLPEKPTSGASSDAETEGPESECPTTDEEEEDEEEDEDEDVRTDVHDSYSVKP